MPSDNGRIGQDQNDIPELDGFLFLVSSLEECGVLARCTELGLSVESWDKPGIEHLLRGEKVILALSRANSPSQRQAIGMAKASKAMIVRHWYPTFLGNGCEKFTDLPPDFRLGLAVALDRPWLLPLPDDQTAAHRNGQLTIGLDEITCKKVDWIYENRIAPGFISLFAGRSGLGKSFVTCDIVSRFSRGETAPYSELKAAKAMRTLFVSEDSPEYVLGPRLVELKAVREMIRFMTLDAMAEFTLNNTDILNRAYEECGRPGLIVIDPPANFLGATDSHKDAEVRTLLKGLIAWIETYHVAAVLITHINKQIGKGLDAIDRIMGSVAWGTTARITCAFARDPDVKGQLLFGGTKNNLGETAEVLSYRIDKTPTLATVTWVGKSDTTMDDAIDRVKKKSRGLCAVEWLEDRFKDRPEWESDELKRIASEEGISKNALWSPEVNALPIKKIKRTRADGESFWVWRANDGWPANQTSGKVGNVGDWTTQDVWPE